MNKKSPAYGCANLSPPVDVDIWFDCRIYHPGDKVAGDVIFRLKRPLNIHSIELQLYGSVRVFMTPAEMTTDPLRPVMHRMHAQEVVLVDKKITLWSDPTVETPRENDNRLTLDDVVRISRNTYIKPISGEHKSCGSSSSSSIRYGPSENKNYGLKSGNHTFRFEMTLPSTGLYSSFKSLESGGEVSYFVRLQTQSINKRFYFGVACPKLLAPELSLNVCNEVILTTKLGDVSMTLQLDKSGFFPGEAICGTATICNASQKASIKRTSIGIVQSTVAVAQEPDYSEQVTHLDYAKIALSTDKIPRGTTQCFPFSLVVPGLAPSLSVDVCLVVSYAVRVTLGWSRNSKAIFGSCEIPIVIVTAPSDLPPPYDGPECSVPNWTSLGMSNPPSYNDAIENSNFQCSRGVETNAEDKTPLIDVIENKKFR